MALIMAQNLKLGYFGLYKKEISSIKNSKEKNSPCHYITWECDFYSLGSPYIKMV